MTESQRPPNARREPRVETTVRVSFVRWRKTEQARTADVSYKGLSIRMADPPALRSLMRLRLALPSGDRELEIHAMAVHHSPCPDDPSLTTVGVQFWGFAGPERTRWDAFVRDLLQETRVPQSRPELEEEETLEETFIASGVRISPTSQMPQAAGDE